MLRNSGAVCARLLTVAERINSLMLVHVHLNSCVREFFAAGREGFPDQSPPRSTPSGNPDRLEKEIVQPRVSGEAGLGSTPERYWRSQRAKASVRPSLHLRRHAPCLVASLPLAWTHFPDRWPHVMRKRHIRCLSGGTYNKGHATTL